MSELQSRYNFPYRLVSDVIASCKCRGGLIGEIITEFKNLHRRYDNLHYESAGIIAENQRLKHENEFMLRLIEKHKIGE